MDDLNAIITKKAKQGMSKEKRETDGTSEDGFEDLRMAKPVPKNSDYERELKERFIFWVTDANRTGSSSYIRSQEFADTKDNLYDELPPDTKQSIDYGDEKVIRAMFIALSSRNGFLLSQLLSSGVEDVDTLRVTGLGQWKEAYMTNKDDIRRWFWQSRSPSIRRMRQVLGVSELWSDNIPCWSILSFP